MYIYTFRGMLKSGSPIELLNNFTCLILPPPSVNRLWSSRKYSTDLVGHLPLSSSGILLGDQTPVFSCIHVHVYLHVTAEVRSVG